MQQGGCELKGEAILRVFISLAYTRGLNKHPVGEMETKRWIAWENGLNCLWGIELRKVLAFIWICVYLNKQAISVKLTLAICTNRNNLIVGLNNIYNIQTSRTNCKTGSTDKKLHITIL